MARLFLLALIVATATATAFAQTASAPPSTSAHPDAAPRYSLPRAAAIGPTPFAARQIGFNATLGLGLFGLRAGRTPHSPATVDEINAPRQRRAGIGLKLRF